MLLRRHFRGGRLELWHGPFEIDDRLLGRMLCGLLRYRTFDDGSLHNSGPFIFGGFGCSWEIIEVGNERELRGVDRA